MAILSIAQWNLDPAAHAIRQKSHPPLPLELARDQAFDEL
jgi:hypothetical protein